VNYEIKRFARHAVPFVLVGVALYAGLYAASEHLIRTHARRNRFYMVQTAPYARYDYVILGASHAAAFDYEDMNDRLEAMAASKILNLSVVGGGVSVNRLLLDYFLTAHQTAAVVYVVDSFAFYSRTWNEDRLQDARLLYRAPFDPVLARLLVRSPATRLLAFDYVSGFSKINNPDRLQPDISDDEKVRFNRTYRPIKQLDEERFDYLYPMQTPGPVRDHYLAELEDLVRDATAHNIRVIVIKPPIPSRIYRAIPHEREFDTSLTTMLDRAGATFFDFSLAGNDERFFYDTDHLNRTGVLNFFEHYLKNVMPGGGVP
jgi:hypothetical protein